MSGVFATLVPTGHVEALWPAVETYVGNALEYAHGRSVPDDVLSQILGDGHLLWAAFEDATPKGVVVSHISEYPRKRVLSCPIVAGDDFKSWKDPMLDLLRRFAVDNNCEAIEATARLGWARVFKDDGYEALWQTFQLPVARS